VRIEPESAAEVTFRSGDDDDEEDRPNLVLSSAGVVCCPECQRVISYPGFDAMLAFTCPQCGARTMVNPTVQYAGGYFFTW
jgi:hypothetical protein